jgi:hypothetical protein
LIIFQSQSATARNCSKIYSLILVVKLRKLGWRPRNIYTPPNPPFTHIIPDSKNRENLYKQRRKIRRDEERMLTGVGEEGGGG